MASGVLPAFALALAGVAKLHDPILSAQFIARGLGASIPVGLAVARYAAIVELLLAAALCLLCARSRVPALGAALLFSFFLGLQLNVYWSEPSAATCGCFGSLMGGGLAKSGFSQLAIMSALLVVSIIHVLLVQRVAAAAGPGSFRRS